MKRFFSLLTVAIVMSGLMFVGCEKENLVENSPKNEKVINFNNFDLSVKNNMLSFASVDDFDEGLAFLAADEQKDFAEWNKKTDFNSMAKAYKNNKAEMPAEDDILANFLNSENCVEIQGKIFQLNFEKRIVLVFENYKDYMNGKSSKTYTFDDEVLTLEFCEENNIGQIAEKKNDECGCSKGSGCDQYNPSYRTFSRTYIKNNLVYITDVEYKIAYYKSGIYFTLVSKISQSGDLKYKMGVTVEEYSYTTKGNNTGSGSDVNEEAIKNNVKVRPYWGIRGLKNYEIESDFHFYIQNGSDLLNSLQNHANRLPWEHSC